MRFMIVNVIEDDFRAANTADYRNCVPSLMNLIVQRVINLFVSFDPSSKMIPNYGTVFLCRDDRMSSGVVFFA